jgi:hypothetical protein
MCWNGAVPCQLKSRWLAVRAAAAALTVTLVLAAAGCGNGGGDTGNAVPASKSEKAKIDAQKAYNTAFEQCKRIGAATLRANYQKKGKKPVGIGLLAQVYVAETTYFHPHEQQAIKGCAAGLRD